MARLVQNPINPFHQTQVVYDLGEEPTEKLELYEERAKSAISENQSPDLGFRFSTNPYRGCLHGCAYCYARPSHGYLGFGAGSDFDRKIVVKTNIAELLDQELSRREDVELLVLSGNTDAYQAIEHRYQLTRACLEVCLKHDVAVSIITKSALIERDVDLLKALADGPGADVGISVPILDREHSRALEPWASSPARRLAAMKTVADAGIPVSVSIAPLILGLNDETMPEVLRLAKEAGATRAWTALVRLPREVLPVFSERLQATLPLRFEKVMRALREARGGERLSDSRFGKRMAGEGKRYDAVTDLFRLHATRLGLTARAFEDDFVPHRRPARRKRQLELFQP